MEYLFLCLIYLMFFLSGAAALIYQVVWVRSMTLVFGGSHLAVTSVLSIFMAGLAIGGYLFGRYADRVKKPLRLYGLLEVGIAVFAAVFIGLMKIYPSFYVSLAQWRGNSPLYLSSVRVLFSVIALIIPTTLMGGTLPVLSKIVSGHPNRIRGPLSFLYGFNTLGAVLGATVAGFFLMRLYSVSATLHIAIITNLLIGLTSILLQNRAVALLPTTSSIKENPETPQAAAVGTSSLFPFKLVLWGIGMSGFCALGYEVLWSRILTVVVGASVYSFTTMLVAFLAGIALGSEAYGLLPKVFKIEEKGGRRSICWFGMVQVMIGISALFVTLFIRDLPMNIMRLHTYFRGMGLGLLGVRWWSNFALAFSYMIVPAFFMGLAFPLAGKIHAGYRRVVGSAVGEILAYNTVGAILGAGVSGFVMVYLFGIERSLQMFSLLNIGFGLLIYLSARNKKLLSWALSAVIVAILLFLGLNHNALRIWDTKYFAIFRSNQLEAFDSPVKIRDALDNTEVLYYGEGIESIVSSIKVKGGEQSFLTNGRIEASSHLQAQQCQFALSHLPMLLHKNPRKVLVIGLGSGMTLGATSVHPSVEQMTLVEIEPMVLGVARTFEKYNHHVLDNPKLRIVFNDGRNFLMTTKERFDVITADPIHPWFRGAGYLYTTEYFKLVSDHLLPGGIACQWLPIYELTPEDLKCVVSTFRLRFKYTMLWLTHYDAELIGSNTPIRIDEAELDRRIAEPAISNDLKRVMMGTATDFLSYFVMGSDGMRGFSRGGVVNTDDNLYLEFSAPFSIGHPSVMETNVRAIVQYREGILPYLAIPPSPGERRLQEKRWAAHEEAVRKTGQALALFLGGRFRTPEFQRWMQELDLEHSRFAPFRFLKNEYETVLRREPRLLQTVAFTLSDERGGRVQVNISAVLIPVSEERASVVFVDNDAKIWYGELYISGTDRSRWIDQFVTDVMNQLRNAYHQEAVDRMKREGSLPPAGPTLRRIKDIISLKIEENRTSAASN